MLKFRVGLLICLISLAACQRNEAPSAMPKMAGMQQLQVVTVQALLTAVYGAQMKLDHHVDVRKQGQALLSDASALLRRAMSGPEMAAMHRNGAAASPAMKRMHDMGDAAFDLFGLMMALKTEAESTLPLQRLNLQLAMAANAALLRLQMKHRSGKPELHQQLNMHADSLYKHAVDAVAADSGHGEYALLVRRLITLLRSGMNMKQQTRMDRS